jgi:hypothetical protein
MSYGIRLGLALAVTAIAFAGCAGFTEQEASDRCTQEQTARTGGACFDGGVLAQCKQAFEDCGDDVVIDDAACPITYTCPE